MPETGRIVVIGSGPPGATAALFLSRAGAEVLLLEAGSRASAGGVTLQVNGLTLLKSRRPLKERPGFLATADPATQFFEDLAPGGLTNHWTGAVPRFSPDDFADAARSGEAYAWPLGYDDVAPWYDRVEPLLHIAGSARGGERLPAGKVSRARELDRIWAPAAAAAGSFGRTLTVVPFAYGAETTLTFSGTVFNSFVRLVEPELRRHRLEARFDSRVVRLEWSPDTKRVSAVIVRDTRRGTEDRVPCRAVVLAAGALSTAEILLASTSPEFPAGLGNTHGVLGHYLHDHPIGKLVLDLASAVPIHPPCYLTRPTVDRNPPLYTAACMQWGGTASYVRSLFSKEPGRVRQIGFNVFGTMAPTRDNWVALDSQTSGSRDANRLKLHLRYPPETRQALDGARNDMVEILRRAGLKPSIRIWLLEPVGDSKHYGGTCRMHASPRFGMLDGWGRLHSVPNVAVVDSAAFTTGPEKNPALTAMALAARASDRLEKDLRDGRV